MNTLNSVNSTNSTKSAKRNYKATGIIAEYNPFHNGHKYHLLQSMEKSGADVSISVISGYFTQRGEIALLDKWTRAEMAVRNGVNLVVEMPAVFACSNAGYFAEAGVEILEALGVNHIAFGSESGNAEELSRIAREIDANGEILQTAVKKAVKGGLAYPKARSEAVRDLLGEDVARIIESPNNILAVEYIRNMKKAGPIVIKRKGAGYHDVDVSGCQEGGFASATAVRKLLKDGGTRSEKCGNADGSHISRIVPDVSREILEDAGLHGRLADSEMLTPLIIQKVLQTEAEELNNIFGAEEGLGNIMKARVRYWKSYEDIVASLKSKRYTRTRVERVLVRTLLGVSRMDMLSAPKYIRVLAFDEKGSAYLKQIKKSGICPLPIITNINRDTGGFPEIMPTLQKDILAADIYNLALGMDLYENSEYVRKPFSAETWRNDAKTAKTAKTVKTAKTAKTVKTCDTETKTCP